jgi:hypothetical protein
LNSANAMLDDLVEIEASVPHVTQAILASLAREEPKTKRDYFRWIADPRWHEIHERGTAWDQADAGDYVKLVMRRLGVSIEDARPG